MPKVGKRFFPYGPAGEKQAEEYAKKTGQPVTSSPGKEGPKKTDKTTQRKKKK